MSTYKDNDGSYKTHLDPSRSFEHQYQADDYAKTFYGTPQNDDHPSGGTGGPTLDISWGEMKDLGKFFGPVLVLYWVIAFPALNASWLLQHGPAPFSWVGSLLYTVWDCLVKGVGAPYYLAYLFGNKTATIFIMPVIAVIWLIILSAIVMRLRAEYPKLVKKAFYLLSIAAAVPVVLVVIAYLLGAIRGDSIAYFWYGHDPYTSLLWGLFKSDSSRMYF